MKKLVIFIMSVTLLIGCNPKESKSTLPHQNLDANYMYINALITNFNIEDGKYFIYFKHDGERGEIEAKTSTTENIYKGLEEYKSTKAKEDEAYDVYDIMVDGDDGLIIGITPSIKRYE